MVTPEQQSNLRFSPAGIEKCGIIYFFLVTYALSLKEYFYISDSHELQLLTMSTGHFAVLLLMDALLAGAIVKLCLGLRISVSLGQNIIRSMCTNLTELLTFCNLP